MTIASGKLKERHFYKLVYLILFSLVLLSGEDGYFEKGDERANLSNLEVLKEHGVGKEYLSKYYGVAGPMYPLMQYMILPLTKERIHLIRAFNMLCLLVVIYFLSMLLVSNDQAWLIMAVPMTYLCGGYAMTTIPSLLFLIPSFILITRYIGRGYLYLILSGFLLSLAILTRLNLLVLLPTWSVFLSWKYRKDITLAGKQILFLLIGVVPLLFFVFLNWRGIVPPIAAGNIGNTLPELLQEFVWKHVFITAGITALIYLLINYQWYPSLQTISQRHIILVVLTIGIVNYLVNLVNYLPAQVLWSNTNWESKWLYLIGSIFGTGILILTLLLLWGLINSWKNDAVLQNHGALLSLSVLVLSTGFATQVFSSRYAFQAIPFILLTSGSSSSKLSRYCRLFGVFFGLFIYFAFKDYKGTSYIAF